MKKSKLSTMLALTIAFQMVLAPVAIAQSTGSTTDKVFDYANQALNMGMGAYSTFSGGNGAGGSQMPPNTAQDTAFLTKQGTPIADKYFNLQSMRAIPGLEAYISNNNGNKALNNRMLGNNEGKFLDIQQLSCATLPTTLYEADSEVCRNRTINTLTGDANSQRNEAFAYYNQYKQISSQYEKNYSADSNTAGQAFGLGCMNNAMTMLDGFFQYRIDEVNNAIDEMNKEAEAFKRQNEMGLKSIKLSTAILNGANSPFSTDFKDTDAMNFSKRFANPECNSIFAKDGKSGVAEMGKNGGLLGIQENLQDSFTKVPEGSKYSAEQYIGKNTEIIADIQKMAEKVSEQATLNFQQISSGQEGYSEFLDGLNGRVSSEHDANKALNASFFSDLQTRFTKERNALDNEKQLIASELGGSSENAIALISKIDNDSNFEAEVSSLENNIKTDCLKDAGVSSAIARFYDPNLSDSANKQATKPLGRDILAILNNPKYTTEVKKQKIQEIQAPYGKRFEMKLDGYYNNDSVDASGNIVSKKVEAAASVTPGEYFTDIINNCEAEFQVNKLNNKLSGKEAIQHLRSLKDDYKKAASKHAADIKNEVTKKMIDCNNNSAALNSTGVGSCSPEKLSMTNPGFCARGAFSCAKNMESCTHKAEKFVNEIKDERLANVNKYNAAAEDLRKKWVMNVDRALGIFRQEAKGLRSVFGTGFKTPTDTVRNLKDGTQFRDDFLGTKGDELKIQDPDKYLEMAKKDLEALIPSLEDQKKSIMDALKKHYDKTQENYRKVANQAKGIADSCLDAYKSYDKMMADQKKGYDEAQGQMGEKNGSLCSKYSQIMSNNPNGACDSFENVGSDALKAAAKAGGNTGDINSIIDEMRSRCAGEGLDDPYEICTGDLSGKSNISSMCSILNSPAKATEEQKKNYCEEKVGTEKTYSSCTEKEKTLSDEDARGKCGSGEEFKSKTESSEACTVGTGTGQNWRITCTQKATYDCSSIKEKIVAEYKGVRRKEYAQPSQSTPVHPTCTSSNNSGQFNPKSLMPGSSQNPLQQNGPGTTHQ